jgi:hypothetical protein
MVLASKGTSENYQPRSRLLGQGPGPNPWAYVGYLLEAPPRRLEPALADASCPAGSPSSNLADQIDALRRVLVLERPSFGLVPDGEPGRL